jgi:hypothetical protein
MEKFIPERQATIIMAYLGNSSCPFLALFVLKDVSSFCFEINI